MRENRRFSLMMVCLLFLVPSLIQAYTLSGGSWGPQGTTVTYSFDYSGYSYNEPGPYVGNTVPMNAAWEPVIAQAFQTWAAVCGLNFVKVADTGQPFDAAGAGGNIRIALHAIDGALGVLAHAYYPPPNGTSAAGDMHFDSAENWYVGLGNPGGQIDLLTIAIHELGHSFGLGHNNADPTSVMFPTYSGGTKRVLNADDIAGVQSMYGSATPEPEMYVLVILGLGFYFSLPQGRVQRGKPPRNSKNQNS